MSDQKQSAAALERLHTDASGVRGPVAGGRVWLNTVEVADRLVREFIAGLLEQGKTAPGGLMDWVNFRARLLNNLYLGISPSVDYETGPWNRPDQLGEYIQHALVIDGETRLAVRDAFVVLASRVVSLVRESRGNLDAVYRDRLDALVVEMREALTGTAGVSH